MIVGYKYKVGDKVVIKSKKRLQEAYDKNESVGLSQSLLKYAGCTTHITQSHMNGRYVKLDLPCMPGWYWDPDWIIPYKQRSE